MLVRRGLTYVCNPKNNTERIIRKGLPKFFDIDIDNFY